ncbi:adenosylmethionine decarboxylase [Candidatus Azambacteria bacterium]|nr:adenosylmethionine decarboxylase [Candidatus Azambacteria bacterium]MBI3685002.1 adenosylmethionine decarboxylase [Candidatus Azambacteria bacterium]
MGKNDTQVFDLNFEKKVHCEWHEDTPTLHHAVIEGGGITPENLEHAQVIDKLEGFCKKLNLSIVQKLDHQFTPYGKSIVFVLEESHIAIHTWPEKGYIHVDIVTCSKREENSAKLVAEFNKIFNPSYTRLLKLRY